MEEENKQHSKTQDNIQYPAIFKFLMFTMVIGSMICSVSFGVAMVGFLNHTLSRAGIINQQLANLFFAENFVNFLSAGLILFLVIYPLKLILLKMKKSYSAQSQ